MTLKYVCSRLSWILDSSMASLWPCTLLARDVSDSRWSTVLVGIDFRWKLWPRAFMRPRNSSPHARKFARALALLTCAAIPCAGQQSGGSQPPSAVSYNLSFSGNVSPQPTAPPKPQYLVAIYPTLTGRSQTITFSKIEIENKIKKPAVGDSFDVTATASSGLPVVISVESGPATISGHKVTVTGAGTVILLATQAGNSIYKRSTSHLPIDVQPNPDVRTQTITWTVSDHLPVGSQPVNIPATASSGAPVKLSVQSGPATISASTLTITNNDAEAGIVVLTATQAGLPGKYLPASETKSITVVARPNYCLPGLSPLSSISGGKSSRGDAADDSANSLQGVLSLAGSPDPFSLAPLVSNQIAIYSSRYPLDEKDRARLNQVEKELDQLNSSGAASNAPSSNSKRPSGGATGTGNAAGSAFTLELEIPHAAALGDLAMKLSPLGGDTFTVEDAGAGKIRVTSKSTPTCHDITQFLTDVRDLAWHVRPESPVVQVFHVQASDITDVFGGGKSAAPSGNSQPQSQNPGANPSTSGQPQQKSGPTNTSNTRKEGTTTPGGMKSQSSSSNGSTSLNSTTLGAPNAAADQPNQSNSETSDDGNKNSDSGSNANNGNGQGTHQPSTTNSGAPPPPTSISPDLLLFEEPNPGDDAAISERKRIIVLLDLPRPEMLINVWSMQTSSEDPNAVGDANTTIKKKVEQYNEGIQSAVARGWKYLSSGTEADPDFFDSEFYNYITGRYIADPQKIRSTATADMTTVAQDFLDRRSGTVPSSLDDVRKQVGGCEASTYCLGYTTLFNPLKPRLTDMLLATIAAREPASRANETLNRMECLLPDPSCGEKKPDPSSCQDANSSCSSKVPARLTCQERDVWNEDQWQSPVLFLECFRDAASLLLTDSTTKGPSLYAKLTRASVADFLFNYKMSQEFPHDFLPYDLIQSAQALNASLSPFIDAFNMDVTAYQGYLRDQIRGAKSSADESKWVGIDKSTFVNDGIITVRTLSAKDTNVSTQTQNFMDATQQPDIATLISTLGSNAAKIKPSDFLPEPVQLIQSALSTIQSSKIQIGRSLYLDINPRSQAGASSAEIDITMKVGDVSDPTYYSQSKSASGSTADLSRVAQHSTETHVRVDSIKLFEVSSFSAVLQRSRPRFPLLPPFVELPYIGTLAGIPLPAAKEYHSSTAFLSAIVVPTATDIANEISFVTDRIATDSTIGECLSSTQPPAPCQIALRKAETLADLGAPIRDFHRAKINCLAHDRPYAKWPTRPGLTPISCTDLSFDSIIHDLD